MMYSKHDNFLKRRKLSVGKGVNYKIPSEEVFIPWVKQQLEIDENDYGFKNIVGGPIGFTTPYKKYCVNGFLFVIKEYEATKQYQNSGVNASSVMTFQSSSKDKNPLDEIFNIIVRRMAHYNPFDNLQSSGDDSNTVDTGNNSSSNISSKKKSGLTRDIRFQVRIYLPIIYVSFKDVLNDRITLIVKELEECYDISHVAWFDLKEKKLKILGKVIVISTQKFGKERKGGTRGMGTGMNISLVEKVCHIINENEELRSNNNKLKFSTEKLRKDLDALTKYVGNIP
ncbi:hypothetical protein GIB67_015396, partial [Kingdonia uniflora]